MRDEGRGEDDLPPNANSVSATAASRLFNTPSAKFLRASLSSSPTATDGIRDFDRSLSIDANSLKKATKILANFHT